LIIAAAARGVFSACGDGFLATGRTGSRTNARVITDEKLSVASKRGGGHSDVTAGAPIRWTLSTTEERANVITEHAIIAVHPGSEDDFARAFVEARLVITAAPGCAGARLLRGIERPSTFLLLVEWESVEAHVEDFRNSPAFGEWRRIVGPFFAGPPAVDHFSHAADV
jgi:heme-degrading monooxygenase HmoA